MSHLRHPSDRIGSDGADSPGPSSGRDGRAAPGSDTAERRQSSRERTARTSGGGSSRPQSSGAGKKPPVRIGQYTLQQTLGTGSFGKVKLATHSITGHRVAMKIINRRKISSMDMGGRVKREIQYLKLLRHPHIIKLYEVITTPSDIIMVIEYAGGELFQYIVDRGRMSEDEARRFFQQIICAIEYTHRHKIVHRDLKPENLLLDEFLNVKIGDFGLSNIMTDGDFLKTSCGSPNYAAPEVISGKLYAGPEIDIWSCGVILYVMLCGRLPFDDEYIPTLFKKINGGIYSLPSYLSAEAKHLLSCMLVVDPVKRITIAEIRQLPWFKQSLPAYLRPLPPTPAAEAPGFDFTMSRSADPSPEGSEGTTPEPGDALSTPELGHLEEEIVQELAGKMVGFTREDVVQHLLDPSDNQVKVAFQLVRDHKRMLQTAHLEEQKEMQSFLAQSPPAWNAGLSELGRSTSIKRQGRSAPAQPADGNVTDEPDHSMTLDGNATDDANETSDDGGTLLSDEDATDDDLAESATPVHSGIGVLETSLLRGNVGPAGGAPPEPAPAPAAPQRKPRSRWHFGIRSRSPPMEIMLELYRTLQVLGMEWRAPAETQPPKGDKAAGEGDDAAKGDDLFFIETRWKVQNVIVRMNLQLYRVDDANYLVDFRNVGYVRLPPAAPDSSGVDAEALGATLEQAYQQSSQAGAAAAGGVPAATGPSLTPPVPEGRKDVSSPFLFLECATRLIVELAGGG